MTAFCDLNQRRFDTFRNKRSFPLGSRKVLTVRGSAPPRRGSCMKKVLKPGYIFGLIALLLAMSGSAVAASKITGAQIKDGTITSRDVKRHSLSPSNLNFSTVARVVT